MAVDRYNERGENVGSFGGRDRYGSGAIGMVRVDPVLQNMTVMNAPSGFAGDMVMPRVTVDAVEGKYYTWSNEEAFKLESVSGDSVTGLKVASGSTFPRDDVEPAKASYETILYAKEFVLQDRIMKNADNVLNIEAAKTFVFQKQMLNERERRIGDLALSSTYVTTGTTLTGTDQWSDDSSDIIGAIMTAVETVTKSCGQMPNVFACNLECYNEVVHHPDIVDRFKHTGGAGPVTADAFLRLFLPMGGRFAISAASYNTAADGQTVTKAWTWGDHFLVAYVAPSPGQMIPSLGYQFVFDGSGTGFKVERYREEQNAQTVVRLSEDVDEVIVDVSAGYLFTNAIA